MYRITCNADITAAAAKTADRYQLDYVLVDPKECVAVATDGKILAVVNVVATGDVDADPELVHRRALGRPTKKRPVSVEVFGDVHYGQGANDGACLGEGRFPKIDREFYAAAERGGRVVAVDVALLKRLADAVSDAADDRRIVHVCIPEGDEAPWVVLGSEGVGLLMPCTVADRVDVLKAAVVAAEKTKNLPTAFARPAKKQEVASE